MIEPTRTAAAWHDAMEGAAPFELADEVRLAGGQRLKGSRARVYDLLRKTADRDFRHPVGRELGPPGWVPSYYFRRGWSGGNAGDRRLRDLRSLFGVRLESREFRPNGSDPSYTVLWRWLGDDEVQRTETSSDAPGGFSSRISPGERTSEPGTPASPSVAGAAAFRFWTSAGFPGETAPGRIDLAPHRRHLLALPGPAFSDLVVGRCSSQRALEQLRSKLRGNFGALRALLATTGEYVLWLSLEHAETLDTLPTLVDILTRCGATYLGTWQQGERQP